MTEEEMKKHTSEEELPGGHPIDLFGAFLGAFGAFVEFDRRRTSAET